MPCVHLPKAVQKGLQVIYVLHKVAKITDSAEESRLKLANSRVIAHSILPMAFLKTVVKHMGLVQ